MGYILQEGSDLKNFLKESIDSIKLVKSMTLEIRDYSLDIFGKYRIA